MSMLHSSDRLNINQSLNSQVIGHRSCGCWKIKSIFKVLHSTWITIWFYCGDSFTKISQSCPELSFSCIYYEFTCPGAILTVPAPFFLLIMVNWATINFKHCPIVKFTSWSPTFFSPYLVCLPCTLLPEVPHWPHSWGPYQVDLAQDDNCAGNPAHVCHCLYCACDFC